MHAHHLAIVVRDVETCARFYRVVLELEPMQAPRAGVAWFRLGDAILMVEPYTPTEAGESSGAEAVHLEVRPGLHLLSFAIGREERGTWEERLSEHGVAITHRSDYSLYFCDPEQNRLALSHYPDRAS